MTSHLRLSVLIATFRASQVYARDHLGSSRPSSISRAFRLHSMKNISELYEASRRI